MACNKCHSPKCEECGVCNCDVNFLLSHMTEVLELNNKVIDELVEKIKELEKCKLAESSTKGQICKTCSGCLCDGVSACSCDMEE